MANFFKSFLPFLLVTIMTSTIPLSTGQVLKCPEASSIAPCTCLSQDGSLSLTCTGDLVKQQDLSDLILETRSVNNDVIVDPDESLPIAKIDIHTTQLVNLDLGPFENCQFGQGGFNIFDNAQLTLITAPLLMTPIDTTMRLTLKNSPLVNDHNGANFLLAFKPTGVSSVDLSGNKFKGRANNRLMKRLAQYVDLTSLTLRGNHLTVLEDGQFKTLTKLVTLSLQDNNIESLGKDAFLFNEPWLDEQPLEINLDNNELTDQQVNGINGLPTTQRVTKLTFKNNTFTTLSRIFEVFLQSNSVNSLAFDGSPFFCDTSLRWLRDGMADFQPRVKGVTCTNDPGHDVFNSDLVIGDVTPSTAASTDDGDTTTTSEKPTDPPTTKKNGGLKSVEPLGCWIMVTLLVVTMTTKIFGRIV